MILLPILLKLYFLTNLINEGKNLFFVSARVHFGHNVCITKCSFLYNQVLVINESKLESCSFYPSSLRLRSV